MRGYASVCVIALLPRLLLVLVPVAIGGCGSDDDREVEFGLGDDPSPVPTEAPTPAFESQEGRVLPAGTTSVAVEGAPIQLPGHELRGLLLVDLDRDGDRDGIVLTKGEGSLGVHHALRDRERFLPLRRLDRSALADGCDVNEATLRTLSPEYGLVRVGTQCDTEVGPEVLFVVGLSDRPRGLERVTWSPTPEVSAPEFSPVVRDADDDGHPDFGLTVALDDDALRVSLLWLNRPSGLARDTEEPEKTITALADRARGMLQRRPEEALRLSTSAELLHRLLCRESEASVFDLGDVEGIDCGRSSGAFVAAATRVLALVATERYFDAIEARRGLDGPGLRRLPAVEAQVEEGLRSFPVTPAAQVAGPPIAPPPAPALRLPPVAFLSDELVLLRDRPAKLWTVGEPPRPAEGAALQAAGNLVADPTGRFVATGIERRCDGFRLIVHRARDVVEGVVVGSPIATPLIEAQPIANCRTVPPAARADHGGFVALGWAPQGLLLARGRALHLVPLTGDGQAAGPSQVLSDDTPPPLPLPLGSSNRDGTAYAQATPYGILVRGGEERMVRPEGWPTDAPFPHPAISPSGTHVAYVQNGRVQLVSLTAGD
ncbi:MAG: hypothetical protein AAGF12_35465 [Myxococcota bacterium]